MARAAPDYAASRIPARAKLGFDDAIQLQDEMIAVGVLDTLTFGPVPLNKIWHITNAIAWNITGATTLIGIETLTATGQQTVVTQANPPQYQSTVMPGEVWIGAGERIRAYFLAATAGDTLRATTHGTQIDVEL